MAKGFEGIARNREADTSVAEIPCVSKEQAEGVSLLNTAVTQVDKVTQSNAAGAADSANSAEDLNAPAASVKDALQTLQ